ncbi:DNA alkylation repair protein [Ruminococcus sp. OA3]|nr:DNA alkylation repair protein [Ruminococcus sp. OA3]
MGIPDENSIGVPTADIRRLAKEIGNSNELAFELWETGYHEARLLAVLLFEKKQVSAADVEKLMTAATGGIVQETSHSWEVPAQRYAYDVIILDEYGKSCRGKGDSRV